MLQKFADDSSTLQNVEALFNLTSKSMPQLISSFNLSDFVVQKGSQILVAKRVLT